MKNILTISSIFPTKMQIVTDEDVLRIKEKSHSTNKIFSFKINELIHLLNQEFIFINSISDKKKILAFELNDHFVFLELKV